MQATKIILAFCALLVQGAPLQSNDALVRQGAYGNPSSASAKKSSTHETSSPADETSEPVADLATARANEDVYNNKLSETTDNDSSSDKDEDEEKSSAESKRGASAEAKRGEYDPESSTPASPAGAETNIPAKPKKCHSKNKEPSSEATPSEDVTEPAESKDDAAKTADTKKSAAGGVNGEDSDAKADGTKGEDDSEGEDNEIGDSTEKPEAAKSFNGEDSTPAYKKSKIKQLVNPMLPKEPLMMHQKTSLNIEYIHFYLLQNIYKYKVSDQ
ncbi:hypothetical protein DSO57_1000200 [Entomophthora muscae]|uniref:Uncharacterized protein n=1 Tax=Entomophthora muscae TaxID=34485 RepID=A0ACC2U7A2_9FUNG|nr:hypothetical protein DSO57_1000200 [Entomophthora muscae]